MALPPGLADLAAHWGFAEQEVGGGCADFVANCGQARTLVAAKDYQGDKYRL